MGVADLAHGDFDCTHIFEANGSYTGLIDFGEIRGTEPFDLGHFLLHDGETARWPLFDDLLAGYASVDSAPTLDVAAIVRSALQLGTCQLARWMNRVDPTTAATIPIIQTRVEPLDHLLHSKSGSVALGGFGVFLLMRHGSVDYDAQPGRFRGHGIDLLPLTPTGVVEAEDLAVLLAKRGDVDAIISSPMTRSLQTAMILSWRLQLRVQVELDLHEWVPDLSQQWTDGEATRNAYDELRACGGEWPPGGNVSGNRILLFADASSECFNGTQSSRPSRSSAIPESSRR